MTALFLRRVFIAPAEIFKNRTGEQYIFLKHHGHLITKSLDIIITHIHTADLDRTVQYIIQTRDQLYKGRFGTSGSTDDSNGLT